MSDEPTAIPVGEYISDELRERGWSIADLAERIGGDTTASHRELTMMMFSPHPSIALSESMAHGLAIAFGTSPELWLRLDSAWRAAAQHEREQAILARRALRARTPARTDRA